MPVSLFRHRILKVCATIAFVALCSCLNSMESGNKTVRPASCNECHSFAGSKFCDTAAITYKGETTTRCSFCHAGSVKSDSTLNDSTNAQVYHDRMMSAENGPLPVTGNLHANGTVDLEFGQCDLCHDFPPRLLNNPRAQYAHDVHVLLDQMKCCDCHVTSVQCSIDRHPDPSNPQDTVDTLIQIMRQGAGGLLIPVADIRAHLNNKVDVAFRKRAEDSINCGDTFDRNSYLWDGFEKKSHNMKGCACHTW
jgi:hypothetical protein